MKSPELEFESKILENIKLKKFIPKVEETTKSREFFIQI